MWVTSRVTVLLPFVPLIDTIGIRRSASRIQDGGVTRASPIRTAQRSRWRACDPVSRAPRAGEAFASARAMAASAIACARSAPDHG